jgi:hypothetical protein
MFVQFSAKRARVQIEFVFRFKYLKHFSCKSLCAWQKVGSAGEVMQEQGALW